MTDKKIVLCVAVALAGWTTDRVCQAQNRTPQQAEETRPTNDPAVRTTYTLGPDDQIMIQVADVQDLNGKLQRLDPNGDLKLPMIGRVHAAGMTLEQLEGVLIDRLKVYVREPDVAITVTEFHSQPVSVIGAVNTAGVRQLEGRKTLIEVLSLAGGVSADAGPVVRITRRADRGPIPVSNAAADPTGAFTSVDIDLKQLLEGRSPDKNIVIQPHDVISVPRAEMVFVIGEVAKPGPLPLSGGTSVSVVEAVSASGGVLRSAASNHARLLRRVDGAQRRTEVAVDLKGIMQGTSDDVSLQAGDILIVPDSPGKKATARAFEAALQAGLLIGTYGFIH